MFHYRVDISYIYTSFLLFFWILLSFTDKQPEGCTWPVVKTINYSRPRSTVCNQESKGLHECVLFSKSKPHKSNMKRGTFGMTPNSKKVIYSQVKHWTKSKTIYLWKLKQMKHKFHKENVSNLLTWFFFV